MFARAKYLPRISYKSHFLGHLIYWRRITYDYCTRYMALVISDMFLNILFANISKKVEPE